MTNRLARQRIGATLALVLFGTGALAHADDSWNRRDFYFYPGNLVLSRSVYDNKASNVQVGTVLPVNCASTSGGCGAASGAPFDGTYPYVWNNDLYDGSFGITARIYLDQLRRMAT